MKKPTVDIITMGCSKNLVDSETLIGLFEANGYACTHDSEHPKGDIVVINTCGFIEDAKQESIDAILEFAQAKDEGHISRLYVMGCLSQRYKAELEAEIPQVDKYYGKFDYKQLIADLGCADKGRCGRHVTTPRHYAYLKISEGCDRKCAYCAIPIMTGRHTSRPMDEIVDEVRSLVAGGTKEFQVIAQELTYYGVDLDGKQHIAELVERIADVPGVEWIRLHYAYPAETYELLERIRREVPGIHIRTTLMVGFPGETDEDFRELMEFVRWARFERMGAFAYSEEDGTYSAEHYHDDVPPEVKQRRLDELMALQQDISSEVEGSKVGSVMKVIVDRLDGDYYVARSEFCSPEVDPEVLIPASECRLSVGEFYDVRITGAEEFDLYATTILN